MMRKLNFQSCLLLVALASALGCNDRMLDQREVKIYFVPFEIETFLATSRSNIEGNHLHFGEMSEASTNIGKLMNIIAQGEQAAFDESGVRAKIALSNGDVYFIDRYGRVLPPTGEALQIDKAGLEELKTLLMNITREVG